MPKADQPATISQLKELLTASEQRIMDHVDEKVDEKNEALAVMMQKEFLSIHSRLDAADADRDQIKTTQAEHTETLQEHTELLKEHSETLADHGDQLASMNRKLDTEISERDRMQEQHDTHSTQLANHAERLTDLEHAKAA